MSCVNLKERKNVYIYLYILINRNSDGNKYFVMVISFFLSFFFFFSTGFITEFFTSFVLLFCEIFEDNKKKIKKRKPLWSCYTKTGYCKKKGRKK